MPTLAVAVMTRIQTGSTKSETLGHKSWTGQNHIRSRPEPLSSTLPSSPGRLSFMKAKTTSLVSDAMREEITGRLGITSGRYHVCCGQKWEKQSCKNVQFTVLFVSMVLIGGTVFQALEEPNAIERINTMNEQQAAARLRVLQLLGGNESLFEAISKAAFLSDAPSQRLKSDFAFSRYSMSAFAPPQVYEGTWSFFRSGLFSFELVTTIGYGRQAPETLAGQLFVIFYTLIGIPAATISLLHLAERALHCFSRIVQLRANKIRQAFESYDNDNSGQLDEDEFRDAIKHLGMKLSESQFQDLLYEVDTDSSGEIDLEEFTVAVGILQADVTEAASQKYRIKIVVGLFFAWMTIGVIVFSFTESDWNFSTSLYFSFVTLTTIGLGDIYPTNLSSMIFLVVFCMIGLGLLAALLTLGEDLLRKLGKARKVAIRKAREKNLAMRKRRSQEKKSLSKSSGSFTMGMKTFAGQIKKLNSFTGKSLRDLKTGNKGSDIEAGKETTNDIELVEGQKEKVMNSGILK